MQKKPEPNLPLFSYGTLQPGGLFWEQVNKYVNFTIPALLKGRRGESVLGRWPAVFPDDDGEWIDGTCLFPKRSSRDRFWELCAHIEGDLYALHKVVVSIDLPIHGDMKMSAYMYVPDIGVLK